MKYVIDNEPDGVDECFSQSLHGLDSRPDVAIEVKSYYQLVLIESVSKQIQSINNKYSFLKNLTQILPYNCDLFKLFLNFINGKKEFNANIVQYLYDHLVVYSIPNDYLWILLVSIF